MASPQGKVYRINKIQSVSEPGAVSCDAAGTGSGELRDGTQQLGHEALRRLVHLAECAEAEGNIGRAIEAQKAILAYTLPKPKPIETEPEKLEEAERARAAGRLAGSTMPESGNFAEWVEEVHKRVVGDT